MKLLVNLIIFLSLSIKFSYAETTKIDPVKKLGSTLKAITGKSLNKDETKQFLSEFVLILEDERGDGTVTYLFDDRNYSRYKDYEEISTGAWRFTKTGVLRVFNKDIKLSWRIKLGKNDDNNVNIKAKFDPIGKLYSFNYQVKEDFLSELNDHKEKIASEKKRKEQEKIDARKKAEEEKAKLEQEKLEAQRKAEEEKAKVEEEKAKVEEEKNKLEEEKAALEKEIAEQKKQLELEKLYIQLEPEFRNKCTKKALNNLFEAGTPEYKTCILNKGPEKQLNQAEEKKQKAEEEKSKLEQEKKEAQKKAKAEKAKEAKEKKLEAQKKAKEKKLKAKKKKLFDSVINGKWGMKSVPCDMNGGTYFRFISGEEVMYAGGKRTDTGGLSRVEGFTKQVSETRFIVTTTYWPTTKNRMMYEALGNRFTGRVVRTYDIINEDYLKLKSEIQMIDVDAVLAGKKGNQVGYRYKTENSFRERCK